MTLTPPMTENMLHAHCHLADRQIPLWLAEDKCPPTLNGHRAFISYAWASQALITSVLHQTGPRSNLCGNMLGSLPAIDEKRCSRFLTDTRLSLQQYGPRSVRTRSLRQGQDSLPASLYSDA